METKTLNIISIIVVIGLLIFGWFYVFTYGKIDKIEKEEERIISEDEMRNALIEDTCLRYPDSPICNPDAEPVSDEEMQQMQEELTNDTCSRYPDSPICNPDIEPISEEESQEMQQSIIGDTCTRYPDSPICQ